MAKEKTLFACTACGYETSRWVGRCPGCGAWNTMVESAPIVTGAPAKTPKQRPGTGASAMLLREIPEDVAVRSSTGISELDRVLGGGIVEGALMLIGGDPGIGKSTLLLQVCANLCKTGKRVLYVSGEESAKQLKLRANRLGITSETLYVLAENALDNVEEKLRGLSPDVAVIDSIQTMYRPDMASAPGSVSQIRECTSQIMRLCKESGTAIFLVGHVTKDGAIAGPRMLEHMVDVVLYFEGDRQQEYRLLRAVKNRFGSVNELGVFQMTEAGMQIVPNPSEQLLSHRAKGASGSVVFCGLEGSRPLLCVSTLLVLAMFRDSEHISAAYGLALTVTMITTTILLAVYIWHDGKRVGAVVFTVVFLAIQFLFFFASMAKFLHGGWFTMLLTLAILLIMYTWNEGTKLERAQRRHMQPADCVPVLKHLHEDDSIPYFADNIVYLTSDPEMKRVDTDIFFSIFADHPKRARAWWAVSVETSDNPFTREYSVENFGTDFLFRVRIRLGFKVSQSIPAYIHQIMNDLSKSGDLPKQTTRYPKLDADPNIGPIRYVLIHKALMPESKVSQKGAISLKIKYAIRHLAGSPVKWFGLAPYNPLIEIQPLFLATERPPRLKRV